ncbi:enoyl-CoA hydratase/carnithine racemase [Streptosporangium becharense]|uniref:Enoyl-CoA hydratase/carnithine racemase n=1 Tax=Streptosporangium becharense TaxID=1816182 RepID=A0A7W9MDS4_9ACTN|nr:crotonase/enoyl-CoA hydratase family protein [Streptosporangium becharense]MBB2914048.1 enoyl-CoA hydratase/carnithine racemase [Streptosporangium becharense]MBB5817075.1 enoyl-CoA hydratase/carnithine racemase [Streptosporangium becharense]
MSHPNPDLPPSLSLDRRGDIAVLSLNRPEKRNALDDTTIVALGAFFSAPPAWAKAAVLAAEGAHFSAGLDLGELTERDAVGGLHHSRMWHEAFGEITHGSLPVIAILRGAVVGGGLELATAAHLRVAEDTAFFALPEGKRGLFVGGGASVRVSRLIGAQRMTDMMLTGRVLSAEEGESCGLVDYKVAEGEGLAKALDLATRIAENSPVTNYAVLHALPRIAGADAETGLLLESLMAAVAQSSAEAKTRMRDFLDGRAAKVDHAGAAR